MIITNENYKTIYGKLEKFFSHGVFKEWHTFRGGMKKRISRHTRTRVNNDFVIDNTYFVTTRKQDRVFWVDYSENSHLGITVGDEVLFCSNRVIIKREFPAFKYCYGCHFLYTCFQIAPYENKEDINSCHVRRVLIELDKPETYKIIDASCHYLFIGDFITDIKPERLDILALNSLNYYCNAIDYDKKIIFVYKIDLNLTEELKTLIRSRQHGREIIGYINSDTMKPVIYDRNPDGSLKKIDKSIIL